MEAEPGVREVRQGPEAEAVTAPIDTAAIREDVAGEFLAGVVYRLCAEIDGLREAYRVCHQDALVNARSASSAQAGWDELRAEHNAMLRRLRDEIKSWQPEHPGAVECATRVLAALGDEVED